MPYAQVNYSNLCPYKKHGKKWYRKQEKRAREKRINRARRFSDALFFNPTPAEAKLFNALTEQFIVFSAQKEIHHNKEFRIADFYFPRGKYAPLIVEIDGEYHDDPDQKIKDEYRTVFLKEATGCELIRFKNAEVIANVSAIVAKIKEYHVFIKQQT